MAEERSQQRDVQGPSKESSATDKYGAGPGSSGTGKTRLQSQTPENRFGGINPSAPTEATEGPSTNLASPEAGKTQPDVSRGEPARGENQANEGTIEKPFAEKPEAA
ncbi:MAG TPA: hypothetical protein VJQ54_08835 [Candidatus Sulfotelmatobacter sp.]|nr:hypothetical protein [Candidatus Sulfotelmatobacter sp.]